jgi:hypothetical protein
LRQEKRFNRAAVPIEQRYDMVFRALDLDANPF